jgi:hypothetical protein
VKDHVPFKVVRQNGIVWVDRQVDGAFRKALMDGVPVPLRSKMKDALAATPDRNTRAHCRRYFAGEFEAVIARIAPLLIELNRYLSEQRALPGLFDWLEITGLGDDYRMVKAFDAWAQLKDAPKLVRSA